jgi:phosphoglycerate dehydrogenase-like enzyme
LRFAEICTRLAVAGRYAMLCCQYFAKNVPRFLEAKAHRHWDVFETEELRDKTLGLIG